MGTKEKAIQENIKVVEAIERPSLMKFGILALLFILMVQPYFKKYSVLEAIHTSFLIWTVFVLCFPISRGKNLLGSPYYLKTGKRLKYPEAIVWGVAIIGNMLTLASSHSLTIYLRSPLTKMLILIMQKPWPSWLIIIACGTATFYDSVLCNYTKSKVNRKVKLVSRILAVISFSITFILTLPNFWVFA